MFYFALPALLFRTLALRPVARGLGAVGLLVGAKRVLHPLVMLGMMVFAFEVPPHWALAAILNAAIPTAANVFVLAERYGVQPERISSAVFVSTVLAVASFSGVTRLLEF